MKRQALILTGILSLALASSLLLLSSASAYNTVTITHGYLTNTSGTTIWTGDYAWHAMGSPAQAQLLLSGLPSSGSMVINYACTATDNTYWGGKMEFWLEDANDAKLSGGRADGGEAGSRNAPSNCTDHMTMTFTWSQGSGGADGYPTQLYWAGAWANDMTVDITSIYVNGTKVEKVPTATPLPQGQMDCIVLTATTPTSGTVTATATPGGPTVTPGGPTATPTAMVSRTPTPVGTISGTATSTPVTGTTGYDSGVITFAADVSALTALGGVNNPSYPYKFLRWASIAGDDGSPGVAWMHNLAVSGGVTLTQAEVDGGSGMIAFEKSGGFGSGPIAISFYARSAFTITEGSSNWMRVWYLDPNYDGHGLAMWVTQWLDYTPGSGLSPGGQVGGMQLSNVWRKFGYTLNIPAGHTAAAIGFDDYPDMAVGQDPGEPCPAYGCAYMDDLHVAYGNLALLVLPPCNGMNPTPGGGGGWNNVPQKTCMITFITIDVYAVCVPPTDMLDLGGWISWVWCRIRRFFEFGLANNTQVTELWQRQNSNEPIGSINELSSIFVSFSSTLAQMQAMNHPAAQSPLDFVNLFNVSALDNPQLNLHVPDTTNTDYLSQCPSAIATKGQSFSYGACWAIFSLRGSIAVSLMQWFLNAAFLVGLARFIYAIVKSIAN